MKKEIFNVNFQDKYINDYNAFTFCLDLGKELICLKSNEMTLAFSFEDLKEMYQNAKKEINAKNGLTPEDEMPENLLVKRNFTLRDMTLKEYREFINFGYAFAPLLEDLVNFYFTKNHSDDIQNAEWGMLKSIMKDEILDREYVLALYEKDKE